MKYENFSTVEDICKKIDGHMSMLQKLKAGPTVMLSYHSGTNGIFLHLNGSDSENSKLTKEYIDALISDYESRIEILNTQLSSL